jgi:hypothetical protein
MCARRLQPLDEPQVCMKRLWGYKFLYIQEFRVQQRNSNDEVQSNPVLCIVYITALFVPCQCIFEVNRKLEIPKARKPSSLNSKQNKQIE